MRISLPGLLESLRRLLRPAVARPSEWRAGAFRDVQVGRRFGRPRGRELGYWLYLPGGRAPGQAVPLIVMLHGCAQDAAEFAAGTRMNAIAQVHGCAVLYPQQTRRANALRCWNWFEVVTPGHAGESGLIASVVRHVVQRHSLDPRRVYVAGMSAGAAMAGNLALRHPGLFAACGLHSGVMYGAAASAAEAVRVMYAGASVTPQASVAALVAEGGSATAAVPAVVPTMVIQGRADTTVNPVNAEQILLQRLAQAGMLAADGGAIEPTAQLQLRDGERDYTQRDYQHHASVLVRIVLIDELAHAWSGGDPQWRCNDAAGPDASRMMVEFLLGHGLAQAARATPAAPVAELPPPAAAVTG
jgi:poly(hydroxyalkanoate) depolymerase family esterase